jgi:hypothetical protein
LARYAGAVALAMVLLAAALWNDRIMAGNRLIDVVAFACGGSVLAQGADPYRVHPLTECEHAVRAPGLDWPPGSLTLPAPLPPYVLVPFALASRIAPFAVVAWSWIALNVLGVALAAAVLRRRLPQLPPLTIAAFTIVATLPVGILYGQFTGVVLLAVAGSGELLARGHARRATLCCAVAMLQPQVGLAPLIALFVLVPRARLTALACAAALGLASLWPRPDIAREYLTHVLGAHARANLPDFSQYSLPSLLALVHVREAIALACGNAIFALALVAAVIVAGAIARRSGRDEAIPWIAAVIGTFASPHLHFQQLACALPGIAFAVAADGAGPPVLFALAAFAIPWARLALSPVGAFSAGAATLAMCWGLVSRRVAAYAATAATILALALMVAFIRTAPMRDLVPHVPVAGNPLAEVPWAQTMLRMDGAMHTASIIVRVPTWIAMAAALTIVLLALRARPKPAAG